MIICILYEFCHSNFTQIIQILYHIKLFITYTCFKYNLKCIWQLKTSHPTIYILKLNYMNRKDEYDFENTFLISFSVTFEQIFLMWIDAFIFLLLKIKDKYQSINSKPKFRIRIGNYTYGIENEHLKKQLTNVFSSLHKAHHYINYTSQDIRQKKHKCKFLIFHASEKIQYI